MKRTLGLVVAACAIALPVGAQDKGQWGLDLAVATTSSSVGATFHLTPRFALRPSLGFSHTSSDSPDIFSTGEDSVQTTITMKSTTFSPGLEALFYLAHGDALSTYVGASYQHTYSSQASQLVAPTGAVPAEIARSIVNIASIENRATTTTGNVLGAALGLQYVVHKRLSVFGEVGLRYSTSSGTVTAPPPPNGLVVPPTDTRQVGVLSSALGVIFYMK